MSKQKKPTLLIILDGWGIAPPSKGNAITLANTPTLDRLYELYPATTLGATGQDVGLEPNNMSGSETGHMNIGAGRIVPQDSLFITQSIKNDTFFINPVLSGAINHTKKFGSNFHVMGLLGNIDSPHSDPEHFRALLKLAKKNGIKEVYCHLFTDGRDSYPESALEHLKYFKKIISNEGIGKIATLSGRFYAMDRAKNWKRLAMAYDSIVFARGEKAASPEDAIQKNYKKNLTDEFLLPTVITEDGKPIIKLQKNDSLVFFNFRSDRARQFTKLFVACSRDCIIKDKMPEIDKIKNLYFVAMTGFGPDLDVHTAFPGHTIDATLPMALSGFRQLYTAESEKYAHVTYFLNGGYADPVGGEDRVMVNSPIIDSYAKIPQMSAEELTQNIIRNIKINIYDFITVNYANADMVGHTGDVKATVKAVEFIDKQLKALCKEVFKRKGNVIITADHGNAEDMIDFKSDQPNTFHSKNPVPFLVAGELFREKKLKKGILGNVAPTILEIMGVEKPAVMAKNSLLN